MKRQQDRDISPRSKRLRNSYAGAAAPGDHHLLSGAGDMDRRDGRVGGSTGGCASSVSGGGGSSSVLPSKILPVGVSAANSNRGGGGPAGKSYRAAAAYDHDVLVEHSRKPSSYRDPADFAHNSSSSSSSRSTAVDNPRIPQATMPEPYRSLCISNLNPKISESIWIEKLYIEFKRFGVFNIRLSYVGDQRVAYVNFRYPEDARAARHDKSNNLILFDRPIRVEPVLNNRRRSNSPSTTDYISNRPGGGAATLLGTSDRFANRSISPGLPLVAGRRAGRNANPIRDLAREREYIYADSRHGNLDKNPINPRHPSPESEEKATRTLFVGNLDHSVTEMELRRHFEHFGVVEDIDIKRQQRGQGNPYAFVKFINLDCAHRAKIEMSGKQIGKFQCRIGYGKVTPTTCLWVGGLGPWITYTTLYSEFDRFGAIKAIDWLPGKPHAYVLYDSEDAAKAAFQEMRRNPYGEKDFSLRVDFSDSNIAFSSQSLDGGKYDQADHIRDFSSAPTSSYGCNDQRRGADGFVNPHLSDKVRPRDPWHPIEADPINVFRNPDNPRDFEHNRGGRAANSAELVDRAVSLHGDRRKRRSPPEEFLLNQKRYRSLSQERPDLYRPGGLYNDFREQMKPEVLLSKLPHDAAVAAAGDRSLEVNKKARPPTEKELSVAEHVNSLVDLAKCLPVAWNGALILKNSAFLARMHVVSGDVTIVDTLMRDPSTTETSVLRITQRLRLDQPKLDEVGRRVSSSGSHGHCILLALPSTLPNCEVGQIQQRPLKNLVSYLKQKEAAGVISLPPNPSKDKENVGVLHAFPPCQFGYNFLLGCAPKLPAEPIKDDYLVVIVVRGAT
ncbi:RNA-binding protein 15-like [Argonauta hians]